MKARLLPLGGMAVVGVLVAVLLAVTGGSWAAVVVGGLLGAAVGALIGQVAAWARAGAGAARRAELRAQRLEEQLAQQTRGTREQLDRRSREQKQVVMNAHQRVVKVEERLVAVRADLNRAIDDQAALIEAYLQLQRLVPLTAPMPRPGTWAASEDLLLWLVGQVLLRQPRLIVDLGSGQSSVWMAAALRQAGVPGRVVAIDHDEEFARGTRALGEDQGVSEWLEVRHAPLVEVEVDGRRQNWYDPAVFADLDGIGLLSVDGPPGAGSAQARWPALPVLRARLAPGAQVILDDLVRRDEQEIVHDWSARHPDLSVARWEFEKGAAVFTVPGSPAAQR